MLQSSFGHIARLSATAMLQSEVRWCRSEAVEYMKNMLISDSATYNRHSTCVDECFVYDTIQEQVRI